jgi:hypothetical protein
MAGFQGIDSGMDRQEQVVSFSDIISLDSLLGCIAQLCSIWLGVHRSTLICEEAN